MKALAGAAAAAALALTPVAAPAAPVPLTVTVESAFVTLAKPGQPVATTAGRFATSGPVTARGTITTKDTFNATFSAASVVATLESDAGQLVLRIPVTVVPVRFAKSGQPVTAVGYGRGRVVRATGDFAGLGLRLVEAGVLAELASKRQRATYFIT